jgi:hypothetical protein
LEPAKYATVGSVDHFNDAMAYRDAVNAAIREKELDDTHDQNGKTLYTLKFDTALFPGGNTHSPAFVSIEIATPQTSDTDYEALFKEWLVKLNSRLTDDEADMLARIDSATLIPEDIDLVQTYMLEERDNYNAAVRAQKFSPKEEKRLTNLMNARAEYTLMFSFESPASRVEQLKTASKSTKNRLSLLVGMEAALLAKYRHDFAGLVSVDYLFIPVKDRTEEIPTLVEYDPKNPPYHPWTQRKAGESSGLPLFKEILAKWQLEPYVDSIDPQVYAQNISDVSSKIRLIDSAFALSAALGKIGNLAESARSLNETQTLLQAIKRQALAVSFATGPKFGWVLGPPFVIENGQAAFLQAATKQAFSVSVVVPVWARRLELTGYSAWLEKDGSKTNPQCLEKQSVDLPNDLDALTTAILDERTARLPTPSLFSDQPAGQLAIQAGDKEEQTLLVLGRDLWRNPQVFVSSVKADTVDLLPNMKGLLAHFKTFPTNVSNPANLTVVTTFGTASLRGTVTILTPVKSKAATNSLVKLSSSFAVDATIPLTFSLATNALPAGYAGFSIKLTPPGKSADWINLDASTAPVAGTNLPVMIKPPDPQPDHANGFAGQPAFRALSHSTQLYLFSD